MNERTEVDAAIDRSRWPKGPWDGEPDKVQWIDEATGLDCLIVRNGSGNLCGYVGVPEGHPFFLVGYSDCPPPVKCDVEALWCEHSPGHVTNVHGGLTYSNLCAGHICHVPEAGRPDRVWWLGFDTAHSGDVTPGYPESLRALFANGTYKDVPYVKAECARLAEQLATVR